MQTHNSSNIVLALIFVVISSGFPVESLGEKLADTHLQLGEKRILHHGATKTSGPAIQLDQEGVLHVAWKEKTNGKLNIVYLQSSLLNDEFPSPIRVNPDNQFAVSLHEPPALTIGPHQQVYVLWPSPHPQANGNPFASILNLSQSTNKGQTFQPPRQVNDDATVTGHSFDQLATAPDGTVHIAWLDAREGKKDPATYTARTSDHGTTITKNVKIDAPTCVCCRTSVATSHDGIVYVASRKVLSGQVRETVVARSKDGGNTFSPSVVVGHDQWVFAGCPHRPASLGVDGKGRLYVTWYTEGPDDTPGVYFSISDDQGSTFSPRRMLNTSRGTFPDHPQMAVDTHGRVMVIWEEQSPVRREIVMRYSLDHGQTFSAPQKLNIKKAHHPAVAINHQGQAVLAWQEQIAFPKWSTVFQPTSFATHQNHAANIHTP